jgi:peptide/nickel transport system substrate-binding protein
MTRKLTRRLFVVNVTGAMAALAVACQSQEVPVPPKPTEKPAGAAAAAPAATTAPAAPAAKPAEAPKPSEAAKPAADAKPAQAPAQAASTRPAEVARKDTLIMSVSDTFNQFQDAALANPFLRGQQRTGWHFMFEPLFFQNPYWTSDVKWPAGLPGKGNEMPWLAETYQYNADSTEITIKLRDGVTWSDGKPFTSGDIAYTINMLKENSPDLLFAFDMKTWVKDVTAPDPLNVKIVLNNPNPQFVARYLQWFQDLGFPFVPEHVYKGQDQKTFANLDIEKGWPIATGPWKLVSSTADQKIYDRLDDWWGAKTGFRALPKMKRIIILPRFEDEKKIQLHVSAAVDATHDMFPSNIPALLPRTDKVLFWIEGNKPPYGSVSPSTIMMGFNNEREPYNDPEIRKAINFAINRKQVVDTVYQDAGDVSLVPFALLPTLKPFEEAAMELVKKHQIDTTDPNKTAEILERKGWKKDGEGFWAKDGARFPMVVLVSPGFFQDISPVFVTQLRRAGFDASFKSPTNFTELVAQGDADMFVRFDTALYKDPWISLDQYHSRYASPTGQTAAQPYRWKNADYDKAVEEMARTQPTDPKFLQLFTQAMDVWFANLPSLPTVKWYLRVPFNTTYWKGWPTEKNPYVAGGSWHRGGAGPIIHSLEPVS